MNEILRPLIYMLYILVAGLLLYAGSTLFIPLSFAFLIAFILYPVCVWLEKRRFNRGMAVFAALTLLILLVLVFVMLLINQVVAFTAEWPLLKGKLLQTFKTISEYITSRFNISQVKQDEWLENAFKDASGQLPGLVRGIIYSSGVSLFILLIVPVFAALILYNRNLLVTVGCSLFIPQKRGNVISIVKQTVHTYYNFIKGMLIVYVIVGLLNSIGLLILGVPHAFLFGFIASILTFFPYVGIIIGALLPMTVAWVQFNTIWAPLGVMAVFTVVQYLEANIIFPFAVSNRLQINTLSTLIAIIAGGIIWGAAGMILFIPFLGILKLIADNSAGMETLATFLGGKKPIQKNEC